MSKEYWDKRFRQWKEWIDRGSKENDFPWKDEWPLPDDKVKKEKWKWGNCIQSSKILPEPYWGNPLDPSVVFININPGKVSDLNSNQVNYAQMREYDYYLIASENKLKLLPTQKFHQDRFAWAAAQDVKINLKKGLSVELIPWHSEKAAGDVNKYIINNRKAVLNNLKRFAEVLPKTGCFKNTFIVRSAAFMDLLDKKDFGDYFELRNIKHNILAREGHINKPISFLSIVKLKQIYGGAEFLIFHGGQNNDMPSLSYRVLEAKKSLKDFLNDRK